MGFATGRFFDGKIAARHRVEVTLDKNAGVLIFGGASLPTEHRWPLDKLRALSDRARDYELVVTLFDAEGDEVPRDTARLSFSEQGLIRDLRALCPDLHRKDLHKGSWGRIAKRSAIAVIAVLAMLFVILPRMADTLATLIPIKREITFGKTVVGQIERAVGGSELGALHCKGDAGQKALTKMVNRLKAGQDLNYDLTVLVFDHPMLNAFAAPGGQIVVMRGLLEKASGPDAVAAVLAHEIGHVESRDPTRNALRAAGSAGLLSMVFGDFSGGTLIALVGQHLLQADYTREAETAADGFALNMLNAADIDSTSMAEFFDQLTALTDESSKLPDYFSSHPASEGRAAHARDNALTQKQNRPILTDAEWDGLRSICG